ncbi:MAG: response regulator [Planctomycetaceae bacterium]|nr:response regulator [Planctomycetales bacterium]MCB9923882.1 response regulator [Planctomycetaceae bacterium]
MSFRILLADDELHIRRAAEFKLKREYEVLCAEDGQEAWEMILEDRPDVLVTDLQMPRMTGIELIEHIRANEATADLPVILLTAKGFELAHDEVFETLNVFRLVSKPFSPRELCKLVQMSLEDYQSRQEVYASSQG